MYYGILGQVVLLGAAKGVKWCAQAFFYWLTTSEKDLAAFKAEEAAAAAKAAKRDARAAEVRAAQEAARCAHRDANCQSEPYRYRSERHANEALAYRYGIANLIGSDQSREARFEGTSTIRLQKVVQRAPHTYLCRLPDFRDRQVVAVIEPGTEYVKTFLPLDDAWFEKFADFETAVKGGRTFSLKELARLHVEKTVAPAKT